MNKRMTGLFRRVLLLAVLGIFLCAPAFAAGFSDDPDAIETAANSVLKLEVYDKSGRCTATGSGFIMLDNRTMITNYHVIEGAYRIIADSDDGQRYFISTVLLEDRDKDIAILQLTSPSAMKPLTYSTQPVKRGSKVIAIGSPIGLKNTVSMGNVSATYREDGVNWIQFTAPISHGSSGGAVFDDQGRVIGISSATYTEGQNLNLAISIGDVIDLFKAWDGTGSYALAEGSDWIDYEAVIMELLFKTAEEAMEDQISRAFAAGGLVLDYMLTAPTPYELGGENDYYLMAMDGELLFVSPVTDNDDGMASAAILHMFGVQEDSVLFTALTTKEFADAMQEDVTSCMQVSGKDVEDALDALLEMLVSDE